MASSSGNVGKRPLPAELVDVAIPKDFIWGKNTRYGHTRTLQMDTEKPDYGLRIIVRTDQAFHGHPDPSDLQEIHSHAHGVLSLTFRMKFKAG